MTVILRRDPVRWSRTPNARSTRSSLGPTRCFSKSSPASARYNADRKPDELSDLEWMRQRHLRRWRKRIEDDPHRVLLRASKDVLKGHGLEAYIERQREMHRKGFEWVQKAFPDWMLEDMGFRTEDKSAPVDEQVGDRNPKKVKIDTSSNSELLDKTIRQPSINKRDGENMQKEGVRSPSDSRWPREQPLFRSKSPETLHEDTLHGIRGGKQTGEDSASQRQPSSKTGSAHDLSVERPPVLTPTTQGSRQTSKDMTSQKTSFIDEFLAEKTSTPADIIPEHGKPGDWRRTALDRVASSSNSESRRNTAVPVIDVASKDKARSGDPSETGLSWRHPVKPRGKTGSTTEQAVIDFHGASTLRMGRKEVEEFESRFEETDTDLKPPTTSGALGQLAEAGSTPEPKFSRYPRIRTDDWPLFSKKGTVEELKEFEDFKVKNYTIEDVRFGHANSVTSFQPLPDGKSGSHIPPRNSPPEVLKQLPKDDLDFLTADDVRASMGRTKGSRVDKAAARQKLEEDFDKSTPEIDPVLEKKVIHDQYVRRKASEETSAQNWTKPTGGESNKIAPVPNTDDSKHKQASVLETGLGFMSRWLHNGGNLLAKHFWQDPVQLAAGQLSGADEQFLKGIGSGVLKGRRAFASIKDELCEDIPAIEELVSRLDRDEVRASAGPARLYETLPSSLKDTSDLGASRIAAQKRAGRLRQELLDTERQYKKACETVDAMRSASKPSFLQRKRLIYASEVLGKNTKLTRMAVFGLQARIEVEAGASGGLVARELLHRLLTLQDTQLALSRLVSRAMQVQGIDVEASTKADESAVNLLDPSVVEALASVAANESTSRQSVNVATTGINLAEDTSNPRAITLGRSDDEDKSPKSKLFDGPNPLAHSLFRPFGLQLDSLGKEDNTAYKAEKINEEEENVISNVKEANYWQDPPTERPLETQGIQETPKVESVIRQPSIQMLKEDGVSPMLMDDTATVSNSATLPDSHVTVNGGSEVDGELKKDANGEPTKSNDLPYPSAIESKTAIQESSDYSESRQAEHNVPLQKTNDTIESSINPAHECSYDSTTDSYVPITYKTIIYNAETNKLSIATSQVPQPNPAITPIPLHEALATLTHPAKFIDHLPEAFHVIQAKPDVLSVRTASPFNPTAEKNATTTAGTQGVAETEEAEGWKGINPIDGTATLSPTGFVGVGSDIDREDFAERRRKADEYHRGMDKSKKAPDTGEKKRRGKVGVGGVFKTAIWAGAICYVVGVAAEVVKGPF